MTAIALFAGGFFAGVAATLAAGVLILRLTLAHGGLAL